jgi:hypothetical protein
VDAQAKTAAIAIAFGQDFAHLEFANYVFTDDALA